MTDQQDHTLIDLEETDLVLERPEEDVRGRHVLDRDGEEVGRVDGLVVDEQDVRVRFLQVGSGGFLGLGRKERLIPIGTITTVEDDAVRIDVERERVAGSPAYDPGLRRATVVDYSPYYDYYGIPTFWGAGFVPAAAPRRPVADPEEGRPGPG